MKPGTHQPAMTGEHRADHQSTRLRIDPYRLLGVLLCVASAAFVVALVWALVAVLTVMEVLG